MCWQVALFRAGHCLGRCALLARFERNATGYLFEKNRDIADIAQSVPHVGEATQSAEAGPASMAVRFRTP